LDGPQDFYIRSEHILIQMHRFQKFAKLMERIKSTAKPQIDKDANAGKNAKPHKIDKDYLRKYLANQATKPQTSFSSCAMCGHSLVDKPTLNNDVARENKAITEKWLQDHKKVEEYLQTNCNPLLDAKGGLSPNSRIQH
jgi:hypothetical protein